jgi:cellulose synthase/poly-beta-1,6-N-acetylglucosamine synthase-like glycosyltransferase
LSYRAQLAGWSFVYREECQVPSELPVTMAALRSQQQRWAKGSIQTARKILPRLLKERLPLAVKIEAMAHLLANIYWLLGMIVMLTLIRRLPGGSASACIRSCASICRSSWSPAGQS